MISLELTSYRFIQRTFFYDVGHKVQIVGHRGVDNLYRVATELQVNNENALAASGRLQVWHERLDHASVETIKAIAKSDYVEGIKINSFEDFFCNGFFCSGQYGQKAISHTKKC